MDVLLLIVQLGLGLIFVMAGVLKAFEYNKAKERMDWVSDVPKGMVIFLGYVEIVGAMGLLLPISLRMSPFIAPFAALGLAVIMVFAAIFHHSRKEFYMIPINLILLLIALFIAISRLYFQL